MPIIQKNGKGCFEYRFNTTFKDSNVVGNIYFANYVIWQGKCREMFLYEYCPDVIDAISDGLALITLDLSAKFIAQLFSFDQVIMHMYLEAQSDSRMMMRFKYYKEDPDKQLTLVCEGTQATAAMREVNGKMVPTYFPNSMLDTIKNYGM